MKKLILPFLLLMSLGASAQWTSGGTVQGIFTGNKQLRFGFGSNGYIVGYTKAQVDSLFSTVGGLTFTNPLLKTGTVVSLLTDVTPTSLSIKPLTSGGAFTALAAKQNTITTGTISQYFRGDLSLATFPTIYSFSGNTSQYTRGDGTYATLNTTVVPEGTNLYWTPTRFNTAFSGKTSDDLTEGSTNLYYTTARSALKADKATTISAAGNGIMGGGSLAANRNLSLDFNYLDARYAVSGTTLHPLTNGFGVNTFSFNGSAAQSVVIDTANITSKNYFNTRIGTATAATSYNYSTPLAFNTPSLNLTGVIETSSFMSSYTTLSQYYHLGSVSTTIYRRTANNTTVDNWTSPTVVTGVTGLFPYFFTDGISSTVYALTTASDFKSIHMFSSANGTAFTVMNGGSPVVTASSTPTDYNYLLFNAGATIVNGQVHILVEGNAGSGSLAGKGLMGYATAPLSAPVFTLSSTYVMPGGNPQLIYVPERNSIVTLYSSVDVTVSPIDLRLKTATASLSNDLTKLSSWSTGFLLFPNLGTLTADADFVFTPGKTYGAVMFYSNAQAESNVTYTDLARNPLQLYNSVAQYQPYVDPLLPIAPNGVNSTGLLSYSKSTAGTDLKGLELSNGGGGNGGGTNLKFTDAGADASIHGIITGPNEGSGMALLFKTSSNTSGATTKMILERNGSLQLNAYGVGLLTTDASGNVTAVPPSFGATANTVPVRDGSGNLAANNLSATTVNSVGINNQTAGFDLTGGSTTTYTQQVRGSGTLSGTNSGDNSPNSLYSGIVSMTYPGAGIPVSTGSAWSTSITDNSTNWNTAFSQTRQWNGGSTGLVAATGRASLGLGTAALNNTGDFYSSTNPSGYISSYTETDPTVPAYSKTLNAFSVIKASTDPLYQPIGSYEAPLTFSTGLSRATNTITVNYGTSSTTAAVGNDSRINNGQTAYGWGDHAGLYPLLSGSYANPSWITSLPWSKITSTPTTLSGYGITDAAPVSSVLWTRTSGVLNPINAGDRLEIGANSIAAINLQAPTGTSATGMQVANGVGASYIFTEGSVGGTITGSTAYATVIGAGANRPTEIMSNAIVRATISETGALRLHTYGAGVLQTDASGNVTASTITGTVPTGSDGQIVSYFDGGSPIAIGRLSVQNAYDYFTPTTGGTVTLVNNHRNIINPAGALLALTVTLPSSPSDGDVVDIKYTQSISTVTYSGGTVVGGVSSATGGGFVTLTYRSATSSWY